MTFNFSDDGTPETVLADAAAEFGEGLVLTTAFGLEGSVLMHMIARAQLDIRIVTLDTGLFFPETLQTWTRLQKALGLRIESVTPELTLDAQAELHGEALWQRAPDQCCDLRKVRPLRKLLDDASGWITGIRRAQSAERRDAPLVSHDARFGVTKLNPLVAWSTKQVRAYLQEHDVPYNPMFDDGYPSIGCAPCTTRVTAGVDERAGRWQGFEKRECGLHWATPAETNARSAGS